MEITLEKIELVKDRTGVSYKEAKEALEFAGGNVVDAIIYIEENIDNDYSKSESKTASRIVDTVKETVRKGNVTKIRIYHGDDIILNLPVSFGVVGTVLFPWGAVASAVAAAVTKCRVELVKEDGSVVDVSEKAGSVYSTVKDKGGVVVDEMFEKGAEIYATAKEKGAAYYETAKGVGSELYSAAKDKGTEIYGAAKDKAEELAEKYIRKGDAVEEAVKDVAEAAEDLAEAVKEELDATFVDLEKEDHN